MSLKAFDFVKNLQRLRIMEEHLIENSHSKIDNLFLIFLS